MNDSIALTSARLRASINAHGARLETLSLDGGASLVLHADPATHPGWRDAFPGAMVGPIANRVAGGQVMLNGRHYQMICNENGRTALHGGTDGVFQRVWDVLDQSTGDLRLGVTLEDGACGLPGTRRIEVHYALTASTLALTITAQTDTPTPINMAHHPYWRLGDARAHRLYINADRYLPVNEHLIPTGRIAAVAGTAFDHLTPKPLDPAVDHNFCCADAQSNEASLRAILHGADGLVLRIDSTEPGLQVYAGAHLPTLPGTDIAPFSAIALEPQGWPDAVHQPHFPAILCTPERPYRQITHYHIDRAE